MSEMLKKPYKITLWEDRNVYIVNGQKKYQLEENDIIQNQYLEEVCIATIGSNTMDSPIRAFNPILTEDLNGSKTFTFTIYSKYWDDKDEEFKLNPFTNLLVNERKVKLKYGEETKTTTYQYGDVNQDGEVTLEDVALVNKQVNKKIQLTENQLRIADINQDNNITSTDATLIKRVITGNRSPEFLEVEEKNDGWHDFVIKQVQENSENYTYTYTCKDLFINELGKTGYSVELDTELQNNMGTVTRLAGTILEGTDWQVGGSDLIVQKNKESLYSYQLSNDISNVKYAIDGETLYGTISANQVILVFYSSKVEHENPVQFLYRPQAESSTIDQALKNYYQIDEYGFVKDCKNLVVSLPNGWEENLYPTDYFGEKLISKQATEFFPQIEETCKIYKKNNIEYYAYTELEYPSVAEIQSLISNGNGFLSTNGWVADSGGKVVLSYTGSGNIYDSAIELTGKTYNTGFYDNRAQLSPNGFVSGEQYVLMIKGTITNSKNPHLDLYDFHGNLIEQFLEFSSWTPGSEITFEEDSGYQTELSRYTYYIASCASTINYTNLVKDYGDIRFYLTTNLQNSVTPASAIITDCKIFKHRVDNNGKLIVPDLQKVYYTEIINPTGNPKLQGWYEKVNSTYVKTTDETVQDGKTYYDNVPSVIKTRYNFFSTIPEQSIWTKQDLDIAQSFLEDETYNDGGTIKRYLDDYEPVMTENCEKITSITGSKSNRFNLIQSLCEAFECWAKFTIEHDEIGRTVYEYIEVPQDKFLIGKRYYQKLSGTLEDYSDDNNFEIYTGASYPQSGTLYKKVYHKYVSFKEYIGDDNLAGFRYGINLKSIQRNVVSDQIASKVIVQPNTNEFAPNGSCTIQQAFLNPTGENALYNFQYFVNQNLLDGTALNDDLYGYNGGLGFFPKMKDYNEKMQPYINQLTEISKTLYTLESRQAVYNAMKTENERLKNETEEEIRAAGYNPIGNDSVPDYIANLRDRLKTYEGTIEYYGPLVERTNGLVDTYQDKYNTIVTALEEIREQKDQLNNDFENKYYRFIQEGTWTSSDYWDPDLYYDAANMVLYTSSFPQVSYTINVLELSQVEGYENYKFRIADKTYIEDTEFFGYDSKGRPYKEEIVISQVKSNLDDPSQNTITVQNYKTQFQDLFQRMAATSQSLQYHEGEYQRAASAINDDGTINSALMQNTLEANALIIQNARNQSITWDETGITISNFLNANEIVKLTSGGIALTKDGGRSWTTGLTGDGVNADVITAGRIDTDRIRIFNKAMQQTFEWNEKGINAYMWDESITDFNNTGAVNYGQFVRFDKYGLYGYKGGDPSWDPEEITAGIKGIDKVIRDSIFSLTWKGLNINIGTQGSFAAIPPSEITSSTNPSAQKWYERNISNQYILTSDTSPINRKTYYRSDNQVINVNNKFIVDGQGNVIATDGIFSGTIYATNGSFSGNITATTGRFYGDVYLGSSGDTTLQQTLTKINDTATAAADAAQEATTASQTATTASQTATTASQTATAASQAATEAVQGLAAKLDKNGGAGYGYIDYASGSGTDYDGYGVAIIATNTSGSEVSNIKATRNGAGMMSGSSQIYVLTNGNIVLTSPNNSIELYTGEAYQLQVTSNGIYFHISDTWYRLGVNNGYFVALSESP